MIHFQDFLDSFTELLWTFNTTDITIQHCTQVITCTKTLEKKDASSVLITNIEIKHSRKVEMNNSNSIWLAPFWGSPNQPVQNLRKWTLVALASYFACITSITYFLVNNGFHHQWIDKRKEKRMIKRTGGGEWAASPFGLKR